jgi:AcrR family transcriptional regulator
MRRKLSPDIDDKILDEVMTLADERGLDAVSTKEISFNLSISEPVIFSHFKSKYGLIEATYRKAAEPFLGLCHFETGEEETADRYPVFNFRVQQALERKKELSFLKQYNASPVYFELPLVKKVWAPFVKDLKALNPEYFESGGLRLDTDELGFLWLEDTLSLLYCISIFPESFPKRVLVIMSSLGLRGPLGTVAYDKSLMEKGFFLHG